ncbi:MAG: type I methionyl aminopeptidase [Gemmataceae bacterium]|nr:type I methionyl aminopeptidase [Gemmataceae bacterium]
MTESHSYSNNAPELKTEQEIAIMREAGKIVAAAHRIAADMIKPGVRTIDIDMAIEAHFAAHNAKSLFKGYRGNHRTPYPAVTCISINEQVVHGIPSTRTLREGEIVKLDTACSVDGWCADAAVTHAVGEIRPGWRKMIDTAWDALALAIDEMGRRKWWSEVAGAMERLVDKAGFGIVRAYVGHGIGRVLHEGPQVPNFVTRDFRKFDFRLEPGLVIAVEPMVCFGTGDVSLSRDHWTVSTRDGLPSAHVEHTLAITTRGVEILTAPLEPHPSIPVPGPRSIGAAAGTENQPSGAPM